MKGSYVLVSYLSEGAELTVGKLGTFPFPVGYYLYFGSALNSLEGRLSRHLSGDKKLHWHIDYLTGAARMVQVWWALGRERRECSWARLALGQTATTIPVPGFGSSDCRRCPAHLAHTLSWMTVEAIRQSVVENSPGQTLFSCCELPPDPNSCNRDPSNSSSSLNFLGLV